MAATVEINAESLLEYIEKYIQEILRDPESEIAEQKHAALCCCCDLLRRHITPQLVKIVLRKFRSFRKLPRYHSCDLLSKPGSPIEDTIETLTVN